MNPQIIMRVFRLTLLSGSGWKCVFMFVKGKGEPYVQKSFGNW